MQASELGKPSFQTMQQYQIHLGQDINNAWAIVAAQNPDPAWLEQGFKKTFDIVRRVSQEARDRAINEKNGAL